MNKRYEIVLKELSPTPPAASPQTSIPDEAALVAMTIRLAPHIRQALLDESSRRKRERDAGWPIQTIITQALAAYLKITPA